jgi:hypothetical protein
MWNTCIRVTKLTLVLLNWFCKTHIWSIKCQLGFLDGLCNIQMLGIKYACSMKGIEEKTNCDE